MKGPDLSLYDNSSYYPGAGNLKKLAWYFVNCIVLNSCLLPGSSVKVKLLRLFGAKIGENIVIKPRVNIKYPWFLTVGDNAWIGEGAWIDNLTRISIGSNVCLSQGCYLLTGNHDYKDKAFSLIVNEIIVRDGVWVGAKATVCPGVTMEENSILTVGSVLTRDAEVNGIYQGVPANLVRYREMRD